MADILDYLKWRGDLSFDIVSFNDVDNVILCQLSYINFDGIILEDYGAEPLPIGLIADMFANSSDFNERIDIGKLISCRTNGLLPALAESKRFSNMKLSCYADRVDEAEQKQFSAINIDIGNGEHFVAFRGTDNTVVGWKEDFNMGYMPNVPSHFEAVKYLEKIGEITDGPLRVGGHSKGGNLAVYGAAFCSDEVKSRIVQVYNNDGPGFDSSVLATPCYKSVLGRLKTFVPQSSVVGMLLGHEEEYAVVQSIEKGIMQHDPFSWQVDRDGLVLLDRVTDGSRFIDHTLKDWIKKMDSEQRGKFVEAMFAILQSTDASTISDLSVDRIKKTGNIIKTLSSSDEETRKVINSAIHQLILSAKDNMSFFKKKSQDKVLDE